MGLLGFLWNSGNSMSGDTVLMGTLLFVIAGFISILIHELGHALMIKKYNLPTEIVLSSFGGYATHPAGILTRKESFLVTLAGPLIQAIFGLALYLAIPYINLPNSMILTFYIYLMVVSIVWAIFNCIPVIPLDGGRMLEAAMGPRRIKTTLMISMLVAVTACVVGLLPMVNHSSVSLWRCSLFKISKLGRDLNSSIRLALH